MADGNITVEVSTQTAQAELKRLHAENAALKRDLEYARGGLTKGRTRMREDNERLRAVLRQALHALETESEWGGPTPKGAAAIASLREALGPNAPLTGRGQETDRTT